MNILSAEMIRQADAYTIQHEPVSDIDLMERAAMACTNWLVLHLPTGKSLVVFAGNGNNGGDGLAIARMMWGKGFPVKVILAGSDKKRTPSCQINLNRLRTIREISVIQFEDKQPLPAIDPGSDIVVDALFGSGLSRTVEGVPKAIIRHINDSGALTISIDIPSGLYCDQSVAGLKDPAIVRADHTLSFAPMKLAFLFAENDLYSGEVQLLDIGLMQEFIDKAGSRNILTEERDVIPMLPLRNRFSHKGTFGHALLICGAKGKMGAGVLAARACLRSGAGLVTSHIPESGNSILQSAVPEAMLDLDEHPDRFTGLKTTEPYSAIGIGPGIGMEPATQTALKLLIQNASSPLILDADALNILGENKTWLPFLPKGTILTPHKKEFERFAGPCANDFERNEKQRELSVKYGLYILLKGAYTAITTPDGYCYFNPTGNPGMATGGSGDVLTGIITGLRAQGLPPLAACVIGAYLHGLAGDLAAKELSQESLIAGDIVDFLGKAIKQLREY